MVKGLLVVGVCAAATLAADHSGCLNALAAPVRMEQASIQAGGSRKPVIRGRADARTAWLGAEHRGLTIEKTTNRVDRSIAIELRYRQDVVGINVERSGTVVVLRGGKRVRITTAEAFERVQQVLAGSEAVFAALVLHAEREATSDLQAPETSLLSVTAFVASLVGDLDAPRRLSTRFVEKHMGIYRPIRFATCFEQYTKESTAAWNDLQDCMNEANQDESLIQRAYRRVACNGVWLVRAESAWIEYLGCLGPGQLLPG
jgi:hypothetical protein